MFFSQLQWSRHIVGYNKGEQPRTLLDKLNQDQLLGRGALACWLRHTYSWPARNQRKNGVFVRSSDSAEAHADSSPPLRSNSTRKRTEHPPRRCVLRPTTHLDPGPSRRQLLLSGKIARAGQPTNAPSGHALPQFPQGGAKPGAMAIDFSKIEIARWSATVFS